MSRLSIASDTFPTVLPRWGPCSIVFLAGGKKTVILR